MERIEDLRWWKSSYSANGGASCVECAKLPDGGMAVRDTKDRSGPVLTFTPNEWQAFIAGARDGEFDLS